MTASRPRRSGRRGAEIIEFALILPLLLTMLLGIIEYGLMFSQMLSVQSATRDAARWAATPGVPFDEAEEQAILQLREGLELQGLSCTEAQQSAGECELDATLDLVEGYTVVVVQTRLDYTSAAAGLLPVPDQLASSSAFMLNNQPPVVPP